jgi:hypothetical protein
MSGTRVHERAIKFANNRRTHVSFRSLTLHHVAGSADFYNQINTLVAGATTAADDVAVPGKETRDKFFELYAIETLQIFETANSATLFFLVDLLSFCRRTCSLFGLTPKGLMPYRVLLLSFPFRARVANAVDSRCASRTLLARLGPRSIPNGSD